MRWLLILTLSMPCAAQFSEHHDSLKEVGSAKLCCHGWRSLYPSYLAAQGLDAYATDRGSESGNWHERNPLVPRDRAERIAYFAGTAGLVIGLSQLFHKTHHYKLERITLMSGIATETYASVNSLRGLR